MFRPIRIFDAPILAPQAMLWATEVFAKKSRFRYHAYDEAGSDLYPDLPIAVDHGESYMLVYLLGLIEPQSPNQKAILQGMARVRGYQDLVHVAYEPIREDPLGLSMVERISALNNIKKRLRHSIVVLADKAGLIKFDPSLECGNAEMVSRLSDTTP